MSLHGRSPKFAKVRFCMRESQERVDLSRSLIPKADAHRNVRYRGAPSAAVGHELSIEMPNATTASDWLPTFAFGLANGSSCLKRPVGVSGAGGRFTLKLDARQSSSRWQPPGLNVDRPTAAFEASELSLSTLSGPIGVLRCGR